MARYSDIVTDQNGEGLPGAFVTVRDYPSGTLTAITDDLGAAKANPITADANGAYYFNAPLGQYTLEFRLIATEPARKLTLIDISDTIRTDLESSRGAALVSMAAGGTMQDLADKVLGINRGTIVNGNYLDLDRISYFTGNVGGASAYYGVGNRVHPQNSNNIAIARARYEGVQVDTTGGVLTEISVNHSFGYVAGAGNVTDLKVFEGHVRVDGPGDITNEAYIFRATPTVLGATGAIQRITGGSIGQLGHATQVQEVFGFDVADQLAASLVIAYRGAITAAGNKYFLASLANAQSVHLGKFKFGSTSSPVAYVDVAGDILASSEIVSNGGRIGYTTGAGGQVGQVTSRTTAVTINKISGDITLVSAAGSATYQKVRANNSFVAGNDTIRLCQKSGADSYETHITAVQPGYFEFVFRTTGGTTTETPVFNFSVWKGANN